MRPATSSSRPCPRSRWSIAGSTRRGWPPRSNGARPSCRGSCRRFSRTPRSPIRRTTRWRRCCGSSQSRRARSSAPCAAWPRSRFPGRPRAAEGASYPEDDRRWAALVRWLDLPAVYRLIGASGGSARLGGDELARTPLFHVADGARPLRGWLAASLTALDGSELGAIQLLRQARRGLHGGRRVRSRASRPDGVRCRRAGTALPRAGEPKAIDPGPRFERRGVGAPARNCAFAPSRIET